MVGRVKQGRRRGRRERSKTAREGVSELFDHARDDMDAPTLVSLHQLKKSYWSLSPSLARDVTFPPSAQLALPLVQVWMADHFGANEGLSGTWRRTFWKELVRRIEEGVQASDPALELVRPLFRQSDLAHMIAQELDDRLATCLTTAVAQADAECARPQSTQIIDAEEAQPIAETLYMGIARRSDDRHLP